MFILKSRRRAKPTIISQSTNIKGDLSGSTGLEIEGFIEGNIKDFTVNIKKNGKVKGDLEAEFVEVNGKVKGSIKTRILKCSSSSVIIGNLTYRELIVEEGAVIKGSCKKIVPKTKQ